MAPVVHFLPSGPRPATFKDVVRADIVAGKDVVIVRTRK